MRPLQECGDTSATHMAWNPSKKGSDLFSNCRRPPDGNALPEIVRSTPMRLLRFKMLNESGMRLRIGATSIGSQRLRWFKRLDP